MPLRSGPPANFASVEQSGAYVPSASSIESINDDRAERRRAENGRRWVETQLAGEKHLLEMIASGRPLRDVLDALCRFVEDAAPECHCGVYPIDWSGPIFQVGAAPSLPASYTEPVEGLRVGRDVAPCGIAAHLKTQVIVEDIAADARWKDSSYRAHVLAHGLRAVWSTPICSREGHVLGTFCVYQRVPALPSLHQQELIAQVTHIASIAIERAQGEAALRRSEALLAEGQRLSMTGTFWWRVATNEVQWSAESYRILGADPAAPATFALADTRIHPDDAPAVRTRLERAQREGDDFGFECRLLSADGSVTYVRVDARATRDRCAQLEYIGAIQDVTERRRSDEALSKLRSELAHVARVSSLGALTASIAHEVNQPLAGIVTNASTCLRMLTADPPDVEGARETARRTIRDGHRASDVIARLRALFTKKELTLEPVDLNDATREVIALSLSDLQRHQVILHSELSDDLPSVIGDRVQLQQVILNLIRNASDAMTNVHDRPRQLLIRTERESGDGVRAIVRDSGVGIDAPSMAKLFDAFYTTKSGGMGIGLSVSHSIVERHHGRLWAEPNEGPGVTFAFAIPSSPERAVESAF
jgi:PAS domain S-box-containing protein